MDILGLTNELTKVISNVMHVNIQRIIIGNRHFLWTSYCSSSKQQHFEKN